MRLEMMHPADQLVAIMSRIYACGLTTMSGGNLSIREDNGDIWVTPGGVDKGALHRSDIVCVHADGSQSGYQKASSELPFHQAAYAVCSDIKAILHAHSPALITFSLLNRVPDVRLNPNTSLICGSVGWAPYARMGSRELAENLAAEFRQGHAAVLLENHGVCVAADSISKAYMIFETLEYAARSELLASRLGQLRPLTDDQIEIARSMVHKRLSEFQPRQRSSEELGLRRDLISLIQRALDQKLFTSTQGTISACLSDGSFLITPYGMDRRSLDEEDLVLIRRSMKEAGKIPSRAVFLHELVYHHRADIQAIICAQPTNLMAFTLTGTVLNTRLIPESYVLLNRLPTAAYGLNYTDPKKVIGMFGTQSPAILLANDGIIATGQSLMQAFDRFEVAEFTAQAQLAAPQQSDLQPLDDERISELDRYFH